MSSRKYDPLKGGKESSHKPPFAPDRVERGLEADDTLIVLPETKHDDGAREALGDGNLVTGQEGNATPGEDLPALQLHGRRMDSAEVALPVEGGDGPRVGQQEP